MSSSNDTTQATPRTAWDQMDAAPLSGNQKSLVVLGVIGNIAEFFDAFLIGFVVSALSRPWQLGFTEAAVILVGSGVGMMIGNIFWGRFSDRIGRKKTFIWTLIFYAGATLLTLATPDRGWLMLAILRILVGIGIGGFGQAIVPLVQESVPTRLRGRLAGLTLAFIPLGLLLGSLSSAALLDTVGWRGLIAIGALPIFLLIWIRVIPESPRWLAAHGHHDAARDSMAWALQIPAEQVLPIPEPKAAVGARQVGYGLVFSSYRRPLAIVAIGSFCFITASTVIQSWGQTLLVEIEGITPATAGQWFIWISLASLVGRLLVAALADRVGRRGLILICGLGGAAGNLWAALAVGGSAGGVSLFLLAMCVAMFFGDGIFGILDAFHTELFPLDARATGAGLGKGIGVSGKIVGPMVLALASGQANLITPKAAVSAAGTTFTIMAVLLVVGAIVYMFAKETRNVSLEHTGQIQVHAEPGVSA